MKIESLNEEQTQLMEIVKKEWLDIPFGKRKRINRKRAKELIEWLYTLSGLEKPLVIFLESPLGLQYAQNILRNMDFSQVRNQVRNQVENQVWSQVWNQVWNQVESQVGNQVWNQVGNQVWSQVWNENLIYESFSSYGNIWDLGWLSFYDFFERIGFDYNLEAYNNFKELIKIGIYDMIQMDKVCFVASLPKDIFRDDLNRLHSTLKPAISWRDGYKLHYLHGVYFEPKLWRKIVNVKITPKELLSLSNIEQRMAAIKVIGMENILEESGAELMDKVKGYELYKIEGLFKQTAYYLKYKDPSTERIYASGIDPTIGIKGDAIKALAWKFSLEGEFKKDIKLFDIES